MSKDGLAGAWDWVCRSGKNLEYLFVMGMHMPLLTELKNLLAGGTTKMSHLQRFWTCACNLISIGGWHCGFNRIKALMV